MADKLGIDPLTFRRDNALKKGDLAALGYEMQTEVGVLATIQAAKKGALYKNRKQIIKEGSQHFPSLAKFIKRGVGVASQMQGLGLGVGLPDYAKINLSLDSNGQVTIYVSTNEIGQGSYTVYSQIAAERLKVPLQRIVVVGADTEITPDSGTTTASRTTYAVGNAILLAAEKLERELFARAADSMGWSVSTIEMKNGKVISQGKKLPIEKLVDQEPISVRATFRVPVADVELGDGLPHLLYSYGTHVVLVEVNTLTGEISVEAVEAYLDGGRVIFKAGFEGQSEGGVVQGIGYALFEEVLLKTGRFQNTNFDSYLLPTSRDVPVSILTVPVEVQEPTGPMGAKGISETCMVGVAPAILNAIDDAIGVRFTRLPVRPEDVLVALDLKKQEDGGS